MMKQKIIGIGATNVDISIACFDKVNFYDSNRGILDMAVGGVTHNILENYSRLGGECSLISAVGDDFLSALIRKEALEADINIDYLYEVKNHSSSTYISFLDKDGEMCVGGCDMSVMDYLTTDYLKEISDELSESCLIVVDPSIGRENLIYLLKTYSDHPFFLDPVACDYAVTIKDLIGYFDTIKPNRMELEILADCEINNENDMMEACEKLLEKGVKNIFVSLGKEGCYYAGEKGRKRRKFKEVINMVNASGAGDAFMAACIYGRVFQLSLDETLDLALSAGIEAVLSKETVSRNFSLERLKEIRREYK